MADRGFQPDSVEELHRWRALFDHLPAMVGFWDRDLRNVTANRAYVEWFGQTPEVLKGRHIRELLGETLYEQNLASIEGALAGEYQYFERTLLTPSGETRHAQAEYIPAVEDGEVTGFYVLATDVTARAEAERDLLEAEDLARMGHYTFLPGDETLRFSPQMLRLLGRDPAGPTPSMQEYLAGVHPDDLDRVERARSMGARGEEYEASYRVIRPDGEVRHVHSRTRQVLGPDGEVVLLRGVMQDETEAQRMAHDLGAANTTLTDLIGVLGHDLRQPIAVIGGYLEEIADSFGQLSEEQTRGFLAVALKASRRLDLLLTDILTMVNLDTSSLVVRSERVGLRAAVERAATQLSLPLDEVAVPSSIQALVDSTHLQQLLTNLLSNASRYGVRPFEVCSRVEGGWVRLEVRDHGEGVPPDFVPRLFERFARATTGVATTVRGTGFGLHIVRELALANGGDLGYEPADPGSRFVLTLPVASP